MITSFSKILTTFFSIPQKLHFRKSGSSKDLGHEPKKSMILFRRNSEYPFRLESAEEKNYINNLCEQN